MNYNKTILPELVSIKSIISIFKSKICWLVPPDSHDFLEISYVESGESRTLIDGEPIVITEGQIVIFAPNSVHESDRCKNDSYPTLNNVCFEGDISVLQNYMNRPISLTGLQRKHILEIVERGCVHFERKSGEHGMVAKPGVSNYELKRLKNELELFLTDLIENVEEGNDIASNTKNHHSKCFSRLHEFLIKSIGQNPSTEDMADALSVSVSTLKKICHLGSGMSPTAYFIYLKMKRAKELIEESTMNFTEIADFLGYSSVHYFSKLFKEKVGMTPSEYAKSNAKSAYK